MSFRWLCHQVPDAIGDAHAAALPEPLFLDVQARALEMTDAAGRDRLIESLPVFRGVVAAYRAAYLGATATMIPEPNRPQRGNKE